MAAIAILIVVVSGYIFTSRYPIAKFKQIRSSGWAFYLHALTWGVVFCLFSAILLICLDYINILSYAKSIDTFLTKIYTNIEYLKWLFWSICSLFLAWLFGFITSKINYIRRKASQKVAQENELERMLYDAVQTGTPVLVSLDSRKIYVGLVLQTISSDELAKTEFFSIIPLFSGYRDKDTLQIHLPTNYIKFYNTTENEQNLTKFKVVLPVSELIMLSYFDFEAHQKISEYQSNINPQHSFPIKYMNKYY